MIESDLKLWDRIGLWIIVAVSVVPLIPYALNGWGV
jgi:hypothetical protein